MLARCNRTAGLDPNQDLNSGLFMRSEEHTSELQSQSNLVCRLLLEKKKKQPPRSPTARRLPHAALLSLEQFDGPGHHLVERYFGSRREQLVDPDQVRESQRDVLLAY